MHKLSNKILSFKHSTVPGFILSRKALQLKNNLNLRKNKVREKIQTPVL